MIPLGILSLVGALALTPFAQAADACRYVPVATLAFRGDGPVKVPTVDGRVNGKPMVMLFDTGAYTSFLMQHAAERIGLVLNPSFQPVYGVGGASRSYVTRVTDLTIGDTHSGRIDINVIGATALGERFDGIIGADFALQTDLELDFARRQIRMFRARDCTDTFLAYWDHDAMELPFSGDPTFRGAPRFTVEVNGVKLVAMIDTGAVRTTMLRSAAERAGIRIDSDAVVRAGDAIGVGTQKIAAWHTVVDTLTIGSETIRNANLTIRDTAPQGNRYSPEILLGADFLRSHRVLIAMSQKRFYISYLGGEVFPRAAAAPSALPQQAAN